MSGVQGLVLPVPPSANRWWRNVNGRMVKSKDARDYQANVLGRVGRQELIYKPRRVKVTVRWFREMKSGDLDKRLGVLLDALQGICYESDSQIVEIHAYRSDEGTGRIEVEVEEAA